MSLVLFRKFILQILFIKCIYFAIGVLRTRAEVQAMDIEPSSLPHSHYHRGRKVYPRRGNAPTSLPNQHPRGFYQQQQQQAPLQPQAQQPMQQDEDAPMVGVCVQQSPVISH